MMVPPAGFDAILKTTKSRVLIRFAHFGPSPANVPLARLRRLGPCLASNPSKSFHHVIQQRCWITWWCPLLDSNQWPSAPEADALSPELRGLVAHCTVSDDVATPTYAGAPPT